VKHFRTLKFGIGVVYLSAFLLVSLLCVSKKTKIFVLSCLRHVDHD
jgi:hypothetical protein